MEVLTVSIAEGKRDFAKIIRATEEQKQQVIVSRRGRPVAVIIPYQEHIKNRKKEALLRIEEARTVYLGLGLNAEEVYGISKGDLEDRG